MAGNGLLLLRRSAGVCLAVVLTLAALPGPVLAVPLESLAPRAPVAKAHDAGAYQTRLRAGHEALDRNDVGVASKAFAEAHRLDPGASAPLLGLAEVARRRRDPKGVESWLRKALAVASSDAAVHRAWGRHEYASGRYAAAEAAFRRAMSLDPGSVVSYLDLGGLYLTALDKPREAAEVYGEAVRVHSGHAGAHLGLAVALAAQRKFDEAEAALRKAAGLAPRDPSPLHVLGRLHLARGKPDQALAAFGEALRANPDFVPALLDRGDIHVARGEPDKALSDYQRAVRAAPKHAATQFRLGVAYSRRGRMDEAERAYRAALEADPRHAPACNNLAWLLAQRGQRLEEALRLARQAVALAPETGAYHDTLGVVHLVRREPDAAIAAFEKAVATTPPRAEFYYHLGVAHVRKGNRHEATAALKKALELQKDFPQAADARRQLEKLGGG